MLNHRFWCLLFWILCFFVSGCRTSEIEPVPVRPPWPSTAPERFLARRTSTHAEVVAFVEALLPHAPCLRRFDLGQTPGGRPLVAVIAADPPLASPEQARLSGKPSLLFVANIHGGEVENKEAALMLLREIAQGEHRDILRALNVVVVPNLNADGNDAIQLRARPEQAGPALGVGTRANLAGLDLNRDFMKLRAMESTAVVDLLTRLDPLLLIDGHTTDGSYHGYDLTYAGPLSPATDANLLAYVRGRLLPTLRERCADQGVMTFDYGNFAETNADTDLPEWSTFDHLPRFQTNYVGLRNRLSLLVETYAHAPFARRIVSARIFVLEAMRLAAADVLTIARITRRADELLSEPGHQEEFPLDAELAPGTTASLPISSVLEITDPETGSSWLQDSGERTWTDVSVRAHFLGGNSTKFPAAYVVPKACASVLELLQKHGVRVLVVHEPRTIQGQQFRVEKVERAKWPFQDVHLTALQGTWGEAVLELREGDAWVPTTQPLGRLVAYLLEPESEDGVAAWEILSPHAGTNVLTWPIGRVP